ncbi:MAG: 30S ribosomal protein S6e [Candidatus Micrarchaeota archaeon]|nr:30S ribosomal protein S6e [Candidatus Micrarchaeota archaeon]
MKVVYADAKTGKSAQMELDDDKASLFMNHRINEVIDGAALGLSGYKLRITGGSDKSGFAMNRSISGAIKTKILERAGRAGKRKGQYRRRTVRGSMVSNDTELVNTVIVEYGDRPVAELFPEKGKKEKAQ